MISLSDITIGIPLWLRWRLYCSGVLKRRKLPHPAISVGSIVLGGAGKTPMTELVVRELLKHGRKPAILMRGYGRKNSSLRTTVLNGDGAWDTCGDEPVLLSRRLPDVPVVVHKNRYESALAIADSVDAYVLDDGFQHLSVHRDLDIVMLTGAERRIGLFPFGIRRDGLWRLRHPGRNNPAIAVLPQNVENSAVLQFLPPGITLLRSRIAVEGIYPIIDRGQMFPPTMLSRKKVFLAAGIARPERFVDIVESLGAKIAGHTFFRDHQFYRKEQVQLVQRKANKAGAELILTTQKDAVRIERFAPSEIMALSIKMEIVEGDLSEVISSM